MLTSLGGCTRLPQQSDVDSCSEEASSEVISVISFQLSGLCLCRPSLLELELQRKVCAAPLQRLRTKPRLATCLRVRRPTRVQTQPSWEGVPAVAFSAPSPEAEGRRAVLCEAQSAACPRCAPFSLASGWVPPLPRLRGERQRWELPPAPNGDALHVGLTD